VRPGDLRAPDALGDRDVEVQVLTPFVRSVRLQADRRAPAEAGHYVLIVLLIAAALAAQPLAQQPTPTFRSTVNLVLVDVVVRDRRGGVVSGLPPHRCQVV